MVNHILCVECNLTKYKIEDPLYSIVKGGSGLTDKVSASQPRNCGFEPHTGRTMISHKTSVLVGSRKRTENDLNKL